METGKLFELRRRTFDTPHFRGIEFIETEAKSIINHVPGNYLPFEWTINPYRGCSHSCSYCSSPDTRVLMADGRTEMIKNLRVGDRIYGTTLDGNGRRYVTTPVLNHWEMAKPAFRVTLDDGTELVTSDDHRLLSDAGWHYVASGSPALREKQRLLGPGFDRVHEGMLVNQSFSRRITSIKALGYFEEMYDITTGTGDFIANGVISHNCFARATHTYMDMNAGKDFETKIVVKVNAGELLRKELRAKRWKGDGIAMGTATDPYQRAEGKYKLMPQIIGALTDYRNPFSILTKGTLILRDLELLQAAADVTQVTTAFSIGTLDDEVWRKSEPGTPHPRKRIEAVRRLNSAGIPCGVLVAAVLPGISDSKDQLKQVVEAALEAGATHVYPILLHLRPKVREVYMEWLQTEYPHLVGSYEQMYTGAYAPKADQKALSATVQEIIAAAPKIKRPTPVRTGPRHRDASKPRAEVSRLSAEQLQLL